MDIYQTVEAICIIALLGIAWWVFYGGGLERMKRDQAKVNEDNRKIDAFNELAPIYDALVPALDNVIPNVAANINIDALRELKEQLLESSKIAIARHIKLEKWETLSSRSDFDEQIARYKVLYTPDLPRKLEEAVYNAITAYFARLPPYVLEPGLFTVSTNNVLDDRTALDDFFHAFRRPDKIFWPVYLAYLDNHYAADKAIKAHYYEANSSKLYERLVKDTLFENLASPFRKLPVGIPDELRFEGVWIVAPPGRGKTTLLSSMLKADLEKVKDGKASIIIMDSSGELINNVKMLKEFAPGGDLDGKLIYLDPSQNLALNPLNLGGTHTQALSLAEYVLDGLLHTETTEKQGSVLRRILIGVLAIPGATLQTFIDFLRDWRPLLEPHIDKLNSHDSTFFTSGTYDEKLYRGTRDEMYWRIDGVMTKVPLLRQSFKSSEMKIPLGKLMDGGYVIVINNNADLLGGGQEFFSRLFMALILGEAEHRSAIPEHQRFPCYVYIDECDTVIKNDPTTNVLLSKCRKQKIGMVLAHQKLADIKDEQVRAALEDCAVKMANPDKEGPALAALFRTSSDQLKSLKKGQFAVFMRDLTRQAIVVDVPPDKVTAWPKMTDAQFAQIQQNMRDRFSYRPVPEPQEALLRGVAEEGTNYDTGLTTWRP